MRPRLVALRNAVLAAPAPQPLTARLRLEKAVSRAELAVAEAEVRDADGRRGVALPSRHLCFASV